MLLFKFTTAVNSSTNVHMYDIFHKLLALELLFRHQRSKTFCFNNWCTLCLVVAIKLWFSFHLSYVLKPKDNCTPHQLNVKVHENTTFSVWVIAPFFHSFEVWKQKKLPQGEVHVVDDKFLQTTKIIALSTTYFTLTVYIISPYFLRHVFGTNHKNCTINPNVFFFKSAVQNLLDLVHTTVFHHKWTDEASVEVFTIPQVNQGLLLQCKTFRLSRNVVCQIHSGITKFTLQA